MKPDEHQSLERVLESATVVSWPELMQGTQIGLVHIEYGFVAGGTLDYLKFWSSSIRGQWLLACEYWMSASKFHPAGVRFDNGYRSESLTHILESVMQNQSAFVLPEDFGRQGLLQIPTPTQQEALAASAQVGQALSHIRSVLEVAEVA